MADDPTQQQGNDGGSNDIRQLREALNRKDQRIKELEGNVETFRSAALAGLAHQAGYDPESGPVRLVMEKFESDLSPDKLSPDAFTSFAKEWGVEPQLQPQGQVPAQDQGQQQVVPDLSQSQPPDATAQVINQLQSPADQLQAAAAAGQALTPDPNNIPQQIAAAEQEGRWQDSFNLKVAMAPTVPDGFGVGGGSGANPNTGLPTHTPQQ